MSLIERNMTGVRIQKLKEEVKTTMKMKKLAAQYQKGSSKNREMATGIVCTHCYRLRNAEGKWTYIEDQDVFDSYVTIGYGLCSDCATDIFRKLYAKPTIGGFSTDPSPNDFKPPNGDKPWNF